VAAEIHDAPPGHEPPPDGVGTGSAAPPNPTPSNDNGTNGVSTGRVVGGLALVIWGVLVAAAWVLRAPPADWNDAGFVGEFSGTVIGVLLLIGGGIALFRPRKSTGAPPRGPTDNGAEPGSAPETDRR
jgi:hypothetical protein